MTLPQSLVPRSSEEPVDVVVRVIRATDKAVLVDQDGGQCWLPLSLTDDASPPPRRSVEWEGKIRRFCIPLWLAMKHDLWWEECEWEAED